MEDGSSLSVGGGQCSATQLENTNGNASRGVASHARSLFRGVREKQTTGHLPNYTLPSQALGRTGNRVTGILAITP